MYIFALYNICVLRDLVYASDGAQGNKLIYPTPIKMVKVKIFCQQIRFGFK